MPIIRRKDERRPFTILGKFGGGQPTPPPIDYSKEYFFIEDVSGDENVLTIYKPTSGTTYVNVSVSTDKVNWIDLGSTQSGNLTYTIPANGKLYVKGVNNRWGVSTTFQYNNKINCSKPFNVGGNIMSLLYGDDYIDKDVLQQTYTFANLFYQSNIIDASNLILPATTLASRCYHNMFNGCTALTEAPALPATTLASYCYYNMFYSCTALTEAPALPATSLADSCYSNMFNGCTALTEAPALPATTLASYCYYNMFYGCTSLTEAPVLPATKMVSRCYQNMFYSCTALTTSPALPATSLESYCYSNMFNSCTALTESPVLPATQLADECYRFMFQNCESLNKVTTYANNISAKNCLVEWLNNVSPTGDFYNLGTATYPSGSSGIPEGWTEHTSLD